MGIRISMIGGLWDSVKNTFEGIFAFIPQFIYFLYTCCISFLDLMQYVIRKLAGLDVYYVNGEAVSGDIVSDFIGGVLGIGNGGVRYSAISTVFWSLLIFGCILLVLTTIIAIIKNQYNYDEKKSQPMNIVFSSIKTFFLMAIIPLTCLFGVYLSNILLRTLDTITSSASNIQIEEVYKNSSVNYSNIFEKGTTSQGVETYASYDFFEARAFTNTSTFSGIMFKIAARDANRVRSGLYTASDKTTMGTSDFMWTDFGIFTSTSPDQSVRREEVAEMIDFAFANCLTLSNKNMSASVYGKDSEQLTSSYMYFESAVWYLKLKNVSCFSKYNVGLVWYYYNLWSFNFFIAFAGVTACLIIFGSIVFGLITRLVQILCLFLIFPPLVGVGPLDDNKAIKEWQKQFIKDVLMSYGAVVGVNLSFLLLSEMQKVAFFTSNLLNGIMDMVLIIVVLAVIKDIIKVLSSFVGGEDASGVGSSTLDATKKLGTSAGEATLKAANIALKIGSKVTLGGKLLSMATKAHSDKTKKNKENSGYNKQIKKLKDEEEIQNNAAESDQDLSNLDSRKFADILNNDGLSQAEKDAKIDEFVSNSGQSKAKSVYDNFKSEYARRSADIDASNATDAEKNAQKQDLFEELKNEAIDDFAENNDHSIDARTHLKNAADKEAERKFLEEKQKEIDDGIKNEGKENRTRFQNALIDLSGVTLKAVGDITGVRPAWNKMRVDNSKIPDAIMTLRQTFFQEAHWTEMAEKSTTNYGYLTKKQREKYNKEADKLYGKALSEAASESERMKKEIDNFASQIKKYIDRGGSF